MNSDRYSTAPTIDRHAPRTLRLEMKDRDIGHGHVDGGWWPHSYDATEEFPPLIDALIGQIGRIERIGYDVDTWHSVKRKLIHGGEIVRCEGFHTVFAHTVNIVSLVGQQLRLLVVPPQTSEGLAEATLHAASELASIRTVRDILASAGQSVRPTATAPTGRAAGAIRAAQPR